MFAALIVVLLVAAQVGTTQPTTAPATETLSPVLAAALPADSPERAYAEFFNAVREGRVDDAFALAQPVDPAWHALLAAQFKGLHELELAKAETLRRFSDAETKDHFATTGMVPPATVATARSSVKGDVATITMISPDAHRRETTQIDLKRIGGRWLVSAFDAGGTGVDENAYRAEIGNDLPAATQAWTRTAAALADVRKRIERGEFDDGLAVNDALVQATLQQ